jgi:hypothetical protein
MNEYSNGIDLASILIAPPICCFDLFPIAESVIHPFVEPVELREIFYMPSDHAMKPCVGLVKRAYPDTITTARMILGPKPKALFTINRPF